MEQKGLKAAIVQSRRKEIVPLKQAFISFFDVVDLSNVSAPFIGYITIENGRRKYSKIPLNPLYVKGILLL